MAYTIRFPQSVAIECVPDILRRIEKKIAKHGQFKFRAESPTLSFKGLPRNSAVPRVCLALRCVRLVVKKPYCGNHPGPCEVGTKKLNATWLEWADWIEFNSLINDVLDRTGKTKDAEVWSNPMDVKGTFWIRKDGKRRVQYDWYTVHDQWGRDIRVWNPGTPNQFVNAAALAAE